MIIIRRRLIQRSPIKKVEKTKTKMGVKRIVNDKVRKKIGIFVVLTC